MVGNALKNVIAIEDKVLIKPRTLEKKTQIGLYLPAGIQEKEKIQFGYILKLGSGYPMPPEVSLETWEELNEQNHFIPLQVKEGDSAVFIQSQAYQVLFETEKHFTVPQNAILMVQGDEII